VCRTVEKVATSNATVMLLGESGTGKEVLARGLHQASPRKAGKFVAINCAAIPENLLESELFGYEKGAFTGAAKQTLGKIETANGGTLMLDEIGDLPFRCRPSCCDFLARAHHRAARRAPGDSGGCAHCLRHPPGPQALTKEGRFREDLYYRLAEIVINIPPLRERVGDPALLAHAFVRRFAQEQNRSSTAPERRRRACHRGAPWPGNIRELENCIKRATIMADGNQITADDVGLTATVDDATDKSLDLRTVRDEAEKRAVLAAMGRVNGNMAKAAELLGVSRPTLYDLMHRLGLK
jgi:two-component system NtrC family response regulator